MCTKMSFICAYEYEARYMYQQQRKGIGTGATE